MHLSSTCCAFELCAGIALGLVDLSSVFTALTMCITRSVLDTSDVLFIHLCSTDFADQLCAGIALVL